MGQSSSRPTESGRTKFRAGQSLRGEKRHNALKNALNLGFNKKELHEYLLHIVQTEPQSTKLISMLLDFGASVHYKNDLCLRTTATKCDYQTLTLLAGSVFDERAQVFSKVLQKAFDKSSVWNLPDKLNVTRFLLDEGACGEALNIALLRSIERYEAHSRPDDIVDLLLDHGADVNFQEGFALKRACELADQALIEKLLLKRPSQAVRFSAIPYLFDSEVSDDQMAGLVDVVVTTPPSQRNLGLLRTPNSVQILKKFLEKWPSGLQTLQKLIEHGCSMEGPETGEKSSHNNRTFSILFWAISERHSNVSTPCIFALIKAAGSSKNLEYHAVTGKTSLEASMEAGWYDVARELVRAGADISTGRTGSKSILFTAASKDYGLVQAIIGRGVIQDDGSLHEASRTFQVDTVRCLLRADHDPNYPSLLHGGRGALAEIFLKACPSGENQAKITATIESLLERGADPQIHDAGKPLLFVALDHKEAYLLTKALLEAVTSTSIDVDSSLYIKDRIVYSPTMYVSKTKGSEPHQAALLRLLQRNSATKKVYYATKGRQPADAVGVPRQIADTEREKKERAEEEERHEEERRVEEESIEQATKKHKKLLAERKKLHEQKLQEKQDWAEWIEREREDEVAHQKDMADIERQMWKPKLEMEREHRRRAEVETGQAIIYIEPRHLIEDVRDRRRHSPQIQRDRNDDRDRF